MKRRPPWAQHWPLYKEPACGVCGEKDEWKLRYYVCGFRCDDHAPGVSDYAREPLAG